MEEAESEGYVRSLSDLDESSIESMSVTGPFERLKMVEEPSIDSDPNSSLLRSERGAAWLRDQNLRTIKSTLGALPEPSDAASLHPASEVDDNDLSLQKGPGGKYYYQYNSTAGSSSISSIDTGYDETSSVDGDEARYRPTSMEVAWLDSQQQGSSTPVAYRLTQAPSTASDPTPIRDFSQLYPDIPAEVLPFISSASLPPPTELTTCSECGIILDAIRYVCSTCKEKRPGTREELESLTGKSRSCNPFSYPPPGGRTHLQAESSNSGGFKDIFKLRLPGRQPDPGYELCPSCLESAGVHHALEMSLDPGSSPSPASPEHALSAWRRTAPKQKGKLRHAYVEKSWGWGGWQDVRAYQSSVPPVCDLTFEYPQNKTIEPITAALHVVTSSLVAGTNVLLVYSSISARPATGMGIFVVSTPAIANAARCNHFFHSQVHEIHPSHAFLDVFEGRGSGSRSNSDPDLANYHSFSTDTLVPQCE